MTRICSCQRFLAAKGEDEEGDDESGVILYEKESEPRVCSFGGGRRGYPGSPLAHPGTLQLPLWFTALIGRLEMVTGQELIWSRELA